MPAPARQENRVDFVQGVATALTPLAFDEVVMNKAFRRLVDEDAEVSVETGLRAAEKLQSVLDSLDRGVDVAAMWVKLDRVINAVNLRCPRRCVSRSPTSSIRWAGFGVARPRGRPLH